MVGTFDLGYGGYIYTLERKTGEKLIFRCHNRDCRGEWHDRIWIELTFLNLGCCQAPKLDLAPVLALNSKIKIRAETGEPSSAISHSVVRSFPLDSAGELLESDLLLLTSTRCVRCTPSSSHTSFHWSTVFSWERKLQTTITSSEKCWRRMTLKAQRSNL